MEILYRLIQSKPTAAEQNNYRRSMMKSALSTTHLERIEVGGRGGIPVLEETLIKPAFFGG